MENVISSRFKTRINRFGILFDDRRVFVKTIKAIMNLDEEVQRGILALGIHLDNLCEKTQTVIRRLTRKFGSNNANPVVDPIIQSSRYDEDTEIVTVVCDNGEQEDYTVENIMTKRCLGFLEELNNAACLNTELTLILALLPDMLIWRFVNLQGEVTNESEDLDENLMENRRRRRGERWILLI
ncbi:hypothetical protein Hanom_Chr13g01202541 [Helianthus anomalus]